MFNIYESVSYHMTQKESSYRIISKFQYYFVSHKQDTKDVVLQADTRFQAFMVSYKYKFTKEM